MTFRRFDVSTFLSLFAILNSPFAIPRGTSGQLTLTDIEIRSNHPDYVFASQTSAYVATFIYQASGGAEGVFDVAVKTGDDVLILNDSAGALRSSAAGDTELIGVGIDCYQDSHCDDNNDCTTDTCSANVCTYQNVAQGTGCDDGSFCTATDECDGSGTCVGSGTPCGMRTPKCCGAGGQCVCSTCQCLAQ